MNPAVDAQFQQFFQVMFSTALIGVLILGTLRLAFDALSAMVSKHPIITMGILGGMVVYWKFCGKGI